MVLNGNKKPCSLSQSMDLFTLSTPPHPKEWMRGWQR